MKLMERGLVEFDDAYFKEYKKVLDYSEDAKRVVITKYQLKAYETSLSVKIEQRDAGTAHTRSIREAKKLFETLGDFRIAPKLAEGCDILAIVADQRDTLMMRKRQYDAAETPEKYDELAKRAAGDGDILGIPELIEDCKQKAEQLRELKYEELIERMNSTSTAFGMRRRAEEFEQMKGYRDTCIKASECRRLAELYQKNEDKAERKAIIKHRCQVVAVVVTIVAVVILAVVDFDKQYKGAENLMNTGHYDEASEAFARLTVFSLFNDASERINEPFYVQAEELMAQGEYELAVEAFKKAGAFSDAARRINESYYVHAEELLTKGEYQKAFYTFGNASGHRDALTRKWEIGYKHLHYGKIAAGLEHTIGLIKDGTVVVVGSNDFGQSDLSGFSNIVAVSAGSSHTVGLVADGPVLAVGNNRYGQCEVNGWSNIVAIAARGNHTVGLKADGTVVAVGSDDDKQCRVSNWTGIVAVSAGNGNTVALKADGTVMATGRNTAGQCDVNNWKDVVAITAGGAHTVGLKVDGTVMSVGNNSNGLSDDVRDWTDIVAVTAGWACTVALKADGTAVSSGSLYPDACNVSNWMDIVAVSAGSNHIVGLKADGTAVAMGSNYSGKCNVSNWTDIGGSRTLQ